MQVRTAYSEPRGLPEQRCVADNKSSTNSSLAVALRHPTSFQAGCNILVSNLLVYVHSIVVGLKVICPSPDDARGDSVSVQC